jgi:hypothetical protein
MTTEDNMRFVILATMLSVLAVPAFAQGPHGNGNGPPHGVGGGGPHFGNGGGKPPFVNPAPIPLAGAGLPALGLVLGAYSLVRATRKRKKPD